MYIGVWSAIGLVLGMYLLGLTKRMWRRAGKNQGHNRWERTLSNIKFSNYGTHKNNKVKTGIIHLFAQHTSCSLVIQENADPTARQDLEAFHKPSYS